MEFSGEEKIAASRDKVWAFLTDPHQVSQCAPGLQSVEVVDDNNFKMVVQAGVGMIRGNFSFDCEWVELDEPNRARISAKGDAPGSSVTMDSAMDLSDDDSGGTVMNWTADANVSGRLAGVGGRLINPVADRMTRQVFDCIKEKLEAAG